MDYCLRYNRRCRLRSASLAIALAMACTNSPTAWAQNKSAQANPSSAVSVRAYDVGPDRLDALTQQLLQQYSKRPEVRIAADERGGQILVVGPEDVHLGVVAALRAAPPSAMKPASTVATVPLRRISPRSIRAMLAAALPRGESSSEPANSFTLRLADGSQATLRVDDRAKSVSIEAAPPALPALRRLVQTLDAPAGTGATSDVVTLRRAEPAVISRALELAGGQRPSVAHDRKHIGQFVTMLFQPGEQPATESPQNPPQPGEAQESQSDDAGDDDEALGKIGDVRIEYIEGLDQIIITGKKRDVDRVVQLIEEIEAKSLETRPAVEIYYLKNVDGRALTELINQIYTDVFAARQGNVSITPLVKPNALLLIGQPDNIAPVVDLIKLLDRPVPPDTQLKVFQLKFLSAVDAERTVRNFFVDRPGFGTDLRTGLGTRVSVLADFRSNALIVQASPRDMDEVARLLESLDVETAASTNHVRIFRLKNALAEELAPVLQGAITGQATAGGAGIPGLGNLQQATQPGAAGGATATQTTPRSNSLQFLQIDGNNARMLQSGILSDMQITADPRGNALIVSGPAHGMALIDALITQLDELPAMEAQIKVFTIINGDATALADMLRQLFGQATQGQGQGGFPGLQSATGSGDSALVPLRFSVDQRTNSIIASGSSGDLAVVYKILVRLDEGDIRQRLTTVYRLRNAPALDVGNALNQLLQSQRQVNQLAPNLTSPFEQIEREVIVVPEIVSNSLIVSATPRFFEDIRKVVEELDRRPPMVVIQVLLAEVSLNDIDQFGIELGLQDSLLFDRGIGAIGFPFNQAGIGNNNTPASLATRENAAGQALSNFGLGRQDANLGYGGLVLSASSESVSILIRALQQSQRLQILSRPQVQTLDNQPAYVQVGAQVPFIVDSQLTTFGTVNSTEFQNVGVILGVTPRTSPDGMIVMEVDATKSELGPIEEGIPISINQNGDVIRSPQINITRAQTTVSARSGQTVILGGLITKSQAELTRRVPYLADVPVLGRLFRFDSVTNDRRELLIILTPYIMTNEEQVAWLNQRESERMNWCLADVVNIHGESPMDSSGKFDFVGPTMYPESESAWPPAERLEPNPPVDIPPGNPLSPASSPVQPGAIPPVALPPLRPYVPGFNELPAGPPPDLRIPSVPLNPRPRYGPAFGPNGAQLQVPPSTPAVPSRPVPTSVEPAPNVVIPATAQAAAPMPDAGVRPAAYQQVVPQAPVYR